MQAPKRPPPRGAHPPGAPKPTAPVEKTIVPRAGNEAKAVPGIWVQGLTNVLPALGPLQNGEGWKSLDAACKERGLSWSIVQTYCRDGGILETAVIVGSVLTARAERAGSLDPAGAWSCADEALALIAGKVRCGQVD